MTAVEPTTSWADTHALGVQLLDRLFADQWEVIRVDDLPRLVLVPSLWAQLALAVARAGGDGAGSSSARSRPPIATSVLSLIEDMRRVTSALLTALVDTRNEDLIWDKRIGPMEPDPGPDLRANMTRLLNRLFIFGGGVWMPGYVEDLAIWVTAANAVVDPQPKRTSVLRGVPCPCCAATTHVEDRDGDRVVVPSVRVVWSGDLVDRLVCLVCTATWMPANWCRCALGVACPCGDVVASTSLR